MKVIIHDLDETQFKKLLPKDLNCQIISDDKSILNCIGCFGCWIKTPGVCVLKDKYNNMGEILSTCDELIIISKCFYGGYSPFIKNVLDRSISYVHPYFELRNGEMHHKRRYSNKINMKVYFYGKDISKEEKVTAKKLVNAHGINFDCTNPILTFIEDINERSILL